MTGKIYIIGIGPGSSEYLEAQEQLHYLMMSKTKFLLM